MSRQITATPLAMTSLIVEVLKSCFEEPGDFVYVPGRPQDSTLAIMDKNILSEGQVQRRPALITSRGDMNIIRHSLGDFRGGHPDGSKDLSVVMNGSYTIMAIADNSQQVELLAEEVFGCLICFQTVISEDWDFLKFRGVNIGEVQQLEEYKDSFIVPITLTYDIERTWNISKVSPVLKKIDMVLHTGC